MDPLDRTCLCQGPGNRWAVKEAGSLPDTGRASPTAMRLTFCYAGLKIFGLFLFIGISIYANNEVVVPIPDGASPYRAEAVADMSTEAEPPYYRAIKGASTRYALDPNLIATIVYIESGGNVRAVSPRGAKGLMQLTPAVYKKYDVDDPFDIEQNISGGTAYLAFLLRKFDGNLERALAAYNCGPTRVTAAKGLPPIKETQDYVERVMNFYLRGEVPTGIINQES